MAISIGTQTNIDKSNLSAYPNGQILDNTGPGTGTPLICVTASDIWMFFDKIMRQAQLPFNASFDNEVNGYQFVQACAALASKSDFVLAITSVSSILQIPTNLDILQLNEKLICKASADWNTETQIKGTSATLLTVAITRQYKAGDYLMLIRTSGGIQLVSLVTADNISVINGELGFLKATTDTNELAGTTILAATTPASNLYAFTKRVTDPTAATPYLATASTPGLLSAAQWNAIQNFVNPIKNVGWFSGVDPGAGSVGSFYTPSGNVTTAQLTFVGTGGGSNAAGGYSNYLVTMANAMANTNYFVRISLESQGTFSRDNNILSPVWTPVSTTTFNLSLADAVGNTQNLKVHIEVIQLY